ncbi:MAG: hypothetical protein AB1750_19835, partial [Chloroflexota bacterium]
MKRISLALSVLVLALAACQAGGQAVAPTPISNLAPMAFSQPAAIDAGLQQEALVALFQNVNPGVVAIKT